MKKFIELNRKEKIDYLTNNYNITKEEFEKYNIGAFLFNDDFLDNKRAEISFYHNNRFVRIRLTREISYEEAKKL